MEKFVGIVKSVSRGMFISIADWMECKLYCLMSIVMASRPIAPRWITWISCGAAANNAFCS